MSQVTGVGQESRRMLTASADFFSHDNNSFLPDEILLQILQYLPFPDLVTARAVCHSWHYVAQDNQLWREQIPHIFGQTHDLTFRPGDRINFHDLAIQKKREEALIRRWSRIDFKGRNLGDLTGMEQVHPSNMKLFDNKIYFCWLRSSMVFWSHPMLRIIDRRSLTSEDVPLELKDREVENWNKRFSIRAVTSEYLIFCVQLKSNAYFNGQYCEKFCVYDRMAKTYLWESDQHEVCPEIFNSLKSFCIFSYTLFTGKKRVNVRARNLRTGNILYKNKLRKPSSEIKSALSGFLRLKYENPQPGSQRMLYLRDSDSSFALTDCKYISNMNPAGDILYQYDDDEVMLLKQGEAGYINIPLGKIEAARFHLLQDSLWSWFSNKVERISLAGAHLPAKWSWAYQTSDYQIHEPFCIEQEVLRRKNREKGSRYMKCMISNLATGKKVLETIDIEEIIGFDHHVMIVEGRRIGASSFRPVDVYALGEASICINRNMSGNRAFQNYYQDGFLAWQTSTWSHIYWSYIDVANYREQ